ncbi:winged helix-turn-helix domain-containing protein [Pleionea mediterranea]|uniref:DNA-binding winged helix-turn-helix (WHTH) protein n=1 Tax=Pleionea mediterranea TaxID=523701 RepID=A0A316FYP6_9GAMM|nr:winged helix-turn-helix domain-containing protein [Pleionea mediterranea]PWK52836.1 DNA-binding winged helix-turn-helix (wHTH) protein [Pleionea mediterranea]
MSIELNNKLKYKVGSFTIDVRSSIVISPDGKTHELTSKVLKTLLAFLKHPGEYLTNDQISDLVYSDVSITDGTIVYNVRQLRKVFGDKDKTIFENRNKVGYRLTLPVSIDSSTPKKPKSVNSSVIWAGIGTLIVLVTLYTFLKPARVNNTPLYDHASTEPLTYYKGQEYFPSLSDNKEWMIFSYRENSSNWSLYIRQMSSGDVTPLLNDPNFSYKHGSVKKDGKHILFTRLSDGRCELMEGRFEPSSVSVTDIVVIKSCHVSAEGARIIEGIHEQQYIYSNSPAIDQPFSLFSYSNLTGLSERITAPPITGRGDYFMSVSPDKTKLAILRNTQRYKVEVRILDLGTRDNTLVDTVETTIFTVNWSKDGKKLYFKDNSNQIVQLDLITKQRTPVKSPTTPVYAPILIDEDNSRFAVISGSLIDRDITSHNLETKEEKILVDSSFSDSVPVYSQKTQHIAWVSNKTGVFQVWLRAPGEEPHLVTKLQKNGRFTSLDFSTDGLKLGGTFDGRWFVYSLLEDSIHWGANENRYFLNFNWASNSSSAYILGTTNNESIINLLNVEDGSMSPVEKYPNAQLIKQSPNGRWIFAWFKHSHKFVRYDLESDSELLINQSNQMADSNHWYITNTAIFWVENKADGPPYLYSLKHNDTKPALVHSSPLGGYISYNEQDNTIIFTKAIRGNTELIKL